MNRRNFIGSMLAAPAIVRAEILMPSAKIWTPQTNPFVEWKTSKKLFWLEDKPTCSLDGLPRFADAYREAIERQNYRNGGSAAYSVIRI